MTERVFNFSAGPATLPLSVIETIKADLPLFGDTGASILEISHRSKAFDAVITQAEARMRRLLGIPDNYRVMFLQGGASTQFAMLPLNLMAGKPADYVVTGAWSKKAYVEGTKAGTARRIFDSSETGFDRLPGDGDLAIGADAAFVHLCSNETIQGVEFQTYPDTGAVPLVADCSSDFMSRPMDISRFGVVYAGAQKNIGPAGVTVVIMRDELVARTPADQFTMLSYKVQASKGSMFNTPPAFSIYVVGLVMAWLEETIGGLDAMAAINQQKGALLYDTIDGSGGFYRGHAQPEARSLMNVSWTLADPALEPVFVAEAHAAGLHGLKGHRSVGGVRASIYNAMPIEGVSALAQFMADFQVRKG